MRGILSELLYLTGLALATVVACNYYQWVAGWVSQWMVFDPDKLRFVIFLLLLLIVVLLARFAIRSVNQLIQWERVHWAVQGLGLIVGGVRGVWLAGVCALILISTGLPSLVESVTERSRIGPSLVQTSTQYIQQVSDWLPHPQRQDLIPNAKFQMPQLKSKWDQ